MKYKSKRKDQYKSNLEAIAARLLEEAGIPFKYEPWRVELLPSSKWDGISYESVGKKKTFKKVESIRSITYTPDFVGENWVIETKGMKTQDFIIRWKLFKKYLTSNNLNYTLFMPTNTTQIKESIKIILNNESEKDIRRNGEALQARATGENRSDKKSDGRRNGNGRKNSRSKSFKGSSSIS